MRAYIRKHLNPAVGALHSRTQIVGQGDSFAPELNYDLEHEFSASSYMIIIFSFSVCL
jgi:hypothetical protein